MNFLLDFAKRVRVKCGSVSRRVTCRGVDYKTLQNATTPREIVVTSPRNRGLAQTAGVQRASKGRTHATKRYTHDNHLTDHPPSRSSNERHAYHVGFFARMAIGCTWE